jgi:drug/metabolite transporter (DMT)-like permease
LGELVSIFFYIYVVIKRNKKKDEKLVGANPDEEAGETAPPEEELDGEKKPPIPTNFFFCITALCDLTATTINTFGLTYLTTSMFQMMRGLELFFVCLWSKIFLKNPIYRHQILGVGTLIFGLSLVGLNSLIYDQNSEVARNPGVGIILLSTSQLFTSTEYIIQEKFIKHYDVHPFQLVGFEGLWGSLMYSILLAIFQVVSCDDWSEALKKGICFTNDEDESYIEDTRFAFEQMWDNKALLIVYIFYVVSIALYNIVGINLTKLVSSAARAVVDTVRTVFIWAFFLYFTPVEGTKEDFHWLQFIGFMLLVCGTLVYNEIVTLPFWNLDYYTRVNIAKREKERKEGENEEERDKLYNSIKQSIDSNSNENPDKNNE